MKLSKLYFLTLTALIISACGGGSDGASNETSPTSTPTSESDHQTLPSSENTTIGNTENTENTESEVPETEVEPTPIPSINIVQFIANGIPETADGTVNFIKPNQEVVSYNLSEMRSQSGVTLASNDYSVESTILYEGINYVLTTASISIHSGMTSPVSLNYNALAAEAGVIHITLNNLPSGSTERLVSIYDNESNLVSSQMTNNFNVTLSLNPGTYTISYQGYLDNANNRYYSANNTNNITVTAASTQDLAISYAVDNVFYEVGAYYPAWGTYGRDHQIHHLDAKDLDVLYYAFLNFNANGIVTLGDGYADTEKRFTTDVTTTHGTYKAGTWYGEGSNKPFYGNLERIQQLKTLAKNQYNNDLIAVFSIGGWTWSGNFPSVAADPQKRLAFANSATALVEQYNMDGLDLDWEFPVWGVQNEHINAANTAIAAQGAGITNEQKQAILDQYLQYNDAANYVELIKVVRQKLDNLSNTTGKTYHLSIAINQAPENIALNHYSQMLPYLDSVNIMSYDAAGTWDSTTGHQSPLSATEGADAPNYTTTKGQWNLISSVAALNAEGVSNQKIIAGIPLYGRQWVEVDVGLAHIPGVYQSGITGPGEWENGSLGYNCLMGDSFSNVKDNEVCTSFANTASDYTYILVRDNNNVLRSVGNFGEVGINGYTVSGVTYPFDRIVESYYYNPLSRMFITYDSATMVKIKAHWLKQQGLKGAMFWDTSGDAPNPETNPDPSLIDALANTFN
ncbi:MULTISPECIES: glycoside hydrolase family 18 protein [Cysteiniphilum]|uniref:chitinase n=1 Tax=Cysteiniphilum litorale TaxID=2056700 RepID=A0A8J2Z0X6_9GAMM|nr:MULTISPECIES: glycosyl hydrolase family 18 protein [Cysteiniphilum]GGF86840.1 hypothetical protein GCM10010995_00190 [Cysteiniphilum litorale]